MHWLNAVEHFVRAYATEVPLPWFVFIGSFFEEVISPIPAALIMGVAGSLALLDDRTFWYLSIRHEDIENIGARFVGHHWKDGGILFLLRLLPPFPTTPVSLAAGIIKMDLRVFLAATYAGNFFKDLLYLYAGYAGLGSEE